MRWGNIGSDSDYSDYCSGGRDICTDSDDDDVNNDRNLNNDTGDNDDDDSDV